MLRVPIRMATGLLLLLSAFAPALADPMLLDSIPLAEQPYAVAIAPDGSTALVTRLIQNDVAFIDVQTRTFIGAVAVAEEPVAVAVTPDGALALIASNHGHAITFVDVASRAVVGSIPAPGSPWDVAITPDGGLAVVPGGSSSIDNVLIVDVATRTIVGSVRVGTFVWGVAVTPDGTTALVTDRDADAVHVIDLASRTVVTSIPVGTRPARIAVTPDGATAFVANFVSATVSVIDIATRTVVDTIPIAGIDVWAVAVTTDDTTVFVISQNTQQPQGQVTSINVQSRAVIDTVIAGNRPRGIAVMPSGKVAWIAQEHGDEVLIVAECTDADGDGYYAEAACAGPTRYDCDDAHATCTTECALDNDADETPDCADSCIDTDGDGFGLAGGAGDTCSGLDCDDAHATCTTQCADNDTDGIADCADGCIDRDDDGYGVAGGLGNACLGPDCSDSRPNCAADCVDGDGDSYCRDRDCDDVNPRCNADCEADRDGDGHNCAVDWREHDANSYLGAPEICDGYDNDQDLVIDDGLTCSADCDSPEVIGTNRRITNNPSSSLYPDAVWTGTEYGLVWQDDRDGNPEIYFARLDASAERIGSEVRVTQDPAASTVPIIVWTGTEYALAWYDSPDGEVAVYLARLDPIGQVIDPPHRVTQRAAVVIGPTPAPALVWAGTNYGLAWAIWSDVTQATEVYFRRIDSAGIPLGGETLVSTPGGMWEAYPAIAWTGSRFGIGWANGGSDVPVFAVLDSSGVKLSVNNHGCNYFCGLELLWTGSEFGVLCRFPASIGRLDPNGDRLGWTDIWRQEGFDILPPPPPTFTFSGTEFGVIAPHQGADDLYFGRFDTNGTKLGSDLPFFDPVAIGCPHDFISARNATSLVHSSSGYTAFWCDLRDGNPELYLARIGCNCTDSDGDSVSSCNDCSDANAAVFPGAPQVCDGVNNDCSDPAWPTPPMPDTDQDTDGVTTCAGDCDDDAPLVFPGAPQVCDGVNNDCDDVAWPAVPATEIDVDGDLFSACLGDCDETSPAVYPSAPQLCDRRNNNCSSPNWPEVPANETDSDADGLTACEGDCDDAASAVYPGASQLCDGVNNDCLNAGWPVPPLNETDNDGDSFAECQGDCDDTSVAANPSAPEICDGMDDDCDSFVDEDELGVDTDGDTVRNVCDNCRTVVNPSQLDTDADGRGNSCDNCALVANPGQADPDLDQRGDPCDNCRLDYNPLQDDYDGDATGDACDNCLFNYNPLQTDLDHDVEGDLCDLDDGLIYILFHQPDYVEWQEETGFTSWNSYRGDLTVLRGGGPYTQLPDSNPLASRQCGLTDPWAFDDDPLPGEAAFFLTTGVFGSESALGKDSAGNVRPNANPCP